MLSYLSYPKIHISFLEVGQKEGNTMICLGEEPNTNMSDPRESFEELSFVYNFQNQMKTQVSKLIDARDLKSMLFHYSITQDNVVDT